MLTPRRLAAHLIESGLLAADVICSSDLTIEPVIGRNYNHKITGAKGTPLLTKQGRDESGSVKTEGQVYGLLRDVRPFTPYLPSLRWIDSRRRLLVFDLIPECHSVSEHLRMTGTVDRSHAAALGRALAILHGAGTATMRPLGRPWVLTLPRLRIDFLREISGANLQMVRMLQESRTLCAGLDGLADSWQPSSLIHNDVRFENCLVAVRTDADWTLKLVDWELAGAGDPDWDAGSALASFLAAWIFSMRFEKGWRPARVYRSAQLRLPVLHPAIAAFWSEYVDGRRLGASERDRSLLRAVRFGAARLIQFAFERQMHSKSVTGDVVCLLQLSENLIDHPEPAAADLLRLRSLRR